MVRGLLIYTGVFYFNPVGIKMLRSFKKLFDNIRLFLGAIYKLVGIFISSLLASVIGQGLMGLGVLDKKDRLLSFPLSGLEL